MRRRPDCTVGFGDEISRFFGRYGLAILLALSSLLFAPLPRFFRCLFRLSGLLLCGFLRFLFLNQLLETLLGIRLLNDHGTW